MRQRNLTRPLRTFPDTVLAVKVDDILADNVPDGAYKQGVHHFCCMCPCGCGTMMNLPVALPPKRDGAWEFNGNWDCPTLAPSIRDLAGCRYHGYLQNGMWTFCTDSGAQA